MRPGLTEREANAAEPIGHRVCEVPEPAPLIMLTLAGPIAGGLFILDGYTYPAPSGRGMNLGLVC